MKRSHPIVLGACFALAGFSIGSGCEQEDAVFNTPPPAQEVDAGAEARTAGERVGDVGEVMPDSIYEVLAEATEAAVKEDGFGDLVERFAAGDRARFAGIAEADFQPLNDAARPALNAYKAKYGGDFDINDPVAVFRPLVNIQPKGKTDDKVFARVVMQPKVQGQNLPPYDITMVKDVTWHIDIPDNYDRESLRQELVTHLQKVTQGNNDWPGDKVDGQRLVAYHVLAALSNSAAGAATERAQPGTSGAQAVQGVR